MPCLQCLPFAALSVVIALIAVAVFRGRRDVLDLIPSEGEIRRHVWSQIAGADSSTVPHEWHEIYKKELDRLESIEADRLKPELELALQTPLNEWKTQCPDDHEFWRKLADEAFSRKPDEAELRVLLRRIVQARQSFYAVRRQEIYYRGKTLIFSIASVLIGLTFAVWCLGRLGSASVLQPVALSLSAGWLGGGFTWLLKNRRAVLETGLTQLREMSRWYYPFTRAFIGSVFALVFFAALKAGVIPTPLQGSFDSSMSAAEIERAVQAFKDKALSAAGSSTPAAELEGSVVKFRSLAGAMWKSRNGSTPAQQSDQDWLRQMGLAPGNDSTYTIRDAVTRSSEPVWLLFFLSLMAGFSESLVPSLLERNTK